jgi:hypothetical protein
MQESGTVLAGQRLGSRLRGHGEKNTSEATIFLFSAPRPGAVSIITFGHGQVEV